MPTRPLRTCWCHGDGPAGVGRRRRRPPRRHRLPVRRRAGDGHLPGAADAAAAAARGRAGHRQDRARRGRRRAPRPAAGPAAVLRGDRRDPGALRLGLPAPDPAPAGARGGRLRHRRRGGREEPVRRAVPARPAGAGRAAAEPGGAARRRGGPGRRRVRGVPARGALDVPGEHPRARHRRRPRRRPIVVLTSNRTRELHDALKRRCLYHWIEHPGLEREVQIVRTRAPEVSEELARQVVGVVQQLRRRRAPEAARGRRDPRLGPGAAPPRHHRRWTSSRRPGPWGAGQVPRGLPEGAAGARPDAAAHEHRRPSGSPTRSCSASRGRCARPACRSPRTAPRASWPRWPLVGLDDAAATYVAGRATLCASPDDLARYDQVHEAYFNARDGLPRPRPAEEGVPTFSGLPLAEGDGDGAGESDDPVVRAMASDTEVLRHRDVASMSAAEKRAAGRHVRHPAPAAHRGGVPPGTSGGTAAPSTRRARCAPACGTWASPRRSRGGGAGTSRAASSFWWTCPVR